MGTVTAFSAETLQNFLTTLKEEVDKSHEALDICQEKRSAILRQTSKCGRYQTVGFDLDTDKIGNVVHAAREALQDTKSASAQAKALGERLSTLLKNPDTLGSIEACKDKVEISNTITDEALIKIDEEAHKSLSAMKLLFAEVKVAHDSLEEEIGKTEKAITALQKVGHYAKYGNVSGMITAYDNNESELKALQTELPQNVLDAFKSLIPEISSD